MAHLTTSLQGGEHCQRRVAPDGATVQRGAIVEVLVQAGEQTGKREQR